MKKLRIAGIIVTMSIMLAGGIAIGYGLAINQNMANKGEQMEKSIKIDNRNENKDRKPYANMEWLEEQIKDLEGPLGWLAILSDEKSFGTEYHVSEDSNILETTKAKQLFIMEYILQDENYKAKQFKTIEGKDIKDIENPTDEMTMACLPYDFFDRFYSKWFGGFIDINEVKKPENINEGYLDNYIYYDNLRAGANGINVKEMKITEIKNAPGSNVYSATIELTYSKRASELLGRKADQAKLIYEVIIKDGKEVVQLNEFKIIEKDI